MRWLSQEFHFTPKIDTVFQDISIRQCNLRQMCYSILAVMFALRGRVAK